MAEQNKGQTGLDNLNNALCRQMARLEGADKPEDVTLEIERSRAMTGVSTQLVASGRLRLDAMRLWADNGGGMKGIQRDVLPINEQARLGNGRTAPPQ